MTNGTGRRLNTGQLRACSRRHGRKSIQLRLKEASWRCLRSTSPFPRHRTVSVPSPKPLDWTLWRRCPTSSQLHARHVAPIQLHALTSRGNCSSLEFKCPEMACLAHLVGKSLFSVGGRGSKLVPGSIFLDQLVPWGKCLHRVKKTLLVELGAGRNGLGGRH